MRKKFAILNRFLLLVDYLGATPESSAVSSINKNILPLAIKDEIFSNVSQVLLGAFRLHSPIVILEYEALLVEYRSPFAYNYSEGHRRKE